MKNKLQFTKLQTQHT